MATQWYFTRITTDNTSKQQLADLLGPVYLVSKEYSRRQKLHYHIVHQTSLTKDEIKELVYSTFPNEPKGVSTLKIDTIGPTLEDWEQVSTYTVKNGDFIHSPEFADKINTFVDNSYIKPECYKTQLKSLISNVTEDEYEKINWHRLKIDLAILRASFHMEVYKSKIEALVLAIQIDMNANIAEDLFSLP